MPQKFHLRSKNRPTSDIQPAACYLVPGLDSMQNSKKEIATIYPACDILLHSMTGRDRSPTQHTLQGGREAILPLPPLRRTPFSFFVLKCSFGEHFMTFLLGDQKLLPRSLIRFTNGATYRRSHGFHFRFTGPLLVQFSVTLRVPLTTLSLLAFPGMYVSFSGKLPSIWERQCGQK